MKVPGRIRFAGALTLVLTLGACGGGGAGGGGGDGGSDLPDRASASSEDEEGTLFPLQEGRYRLSYRAPDCEDVNIVIAGADGTPIYEGAPRVATAFINNVPAGEYTITVTSDCDDWTVDLLRF